MIELSANRTYNSKTFYNDDGTFTLHTHGGPVHYFNKLALGDGEVRFREIDFSLKFDEILRGWYFHYNNFIPFIPEYADGWAEFRDIVDGKDQTFRFKAICNHVPGKVSTYKELGIFNESDLNCVIYENAFGVGFDYIICFTRSSLVKLVRIREGYAPKESVSFDFEMNFPESTDIFRGKIISETYEKSNTTGSLLVYREYDSYKLDFLSDKEFDSVNELLIGNDQFDGKEWFTHVRSFKTWDSTLKNKVLGNAGIVIKDGQIILRKTIPISFIETAVGDIFTDATASPFSAAGDGHVEYADTLNGDWDTCHDASTGKTAEYTNYFAWGPEVYMLRTEECTIARAFLAFNTGAALPDGATVTAASLFLYGREVRAGLSTYNYINVVNSTQSSTTTLSTSDYNKCGSTQSPTVGASNFNVSSFSTTAYNEIALNSTGKGWISTTAYTKIGVRLGHDIADVDPNADDYNRARFYTSEDATGGGGTDRDPYLSITYTAGSPSMSPSTSPSVSPSLSPSVSNSPSTSPSVSPSKSPSVSPSVSPSKSPSVSPSKSPSQSPSISPSSSVSPSPSPGYQGYSRGNYAALPANDADLSTIYDSADLTTVSSINEQWVFIVGSNNYMVHQFKDYAGSATKCIVRWVGKSSLPASVSTIYLQIYNRTSGEWETLTSDSTSAAETNLLLEADVHDLTNYKDGNTVVSCRVYQLDT